MSAEYLGEIIRQLLLTLIRLGLYQGRCPANVLQCGGLNAKLISDIEARSATCNTLDVYNQIILTQSLLFFVPGSDTDLERCKELLRREFGLRNVTDTDCEVTQQVCEVVTTRASRLAAAAVVSIVKKIDKVDRCTVAVDGMLYHEHQRFRVR